MKSPRLEKVCWFSIAVVAIKLFFDEVQESVDKGVVDIDFVDHTRAGLLLIDVGLFVVVAQLLPELENFVVFVLKCRLKLAQLRLEPEMEWKEHFDSRAPLSKTDKFDDKAAMVVDKISEHYVEKLLNYFPRPLVTCDQFRTLDS